MATAVESLTGHGAPPEMLGRFEVRRLLGEGAFGEVFLGFDPDLRRPVALKLLKRSCSPDALIRLRKEAQAMAALDHPALLSVFEIGTADQRDYIAMELAEGGTLHQWAQREQPSLEAIVRHIERAARALAVAHHAGLLHCDIKPSNLLIGGDGKVRVSDFGLVATPQADHAQQAQDHALAGTPHYMAPELFDGAAPTAATDQYALCLTLYELVYERRPQGTPPAREDIDVPEARTASRRRVPAWLRGAIHRGLRHEPAQRFSSVGQLAVALARGLGTRRRRGTRVAAGAIVLSAVAAGWSMRGAEGINTTAASPSCLQQAQDELAQVWSTDRARALELALEHDGPAYAVEVSAAIQASLDRDSASWVQAMTDACRTDEPASERIVCLQDQRRVLDAELSALTADGTANLAATARALAHTVDVDACEQTTRPSLRPLTGDDQERAVTITTGLDAAAALSTRGEFERANAVAATQLRAARDLGAPRLIVRAGNLVANTFGLRGQHDAVTEPALATFHAALAAGLDVGADDAARKIAAALANDAQPKGAVRWAQLSVTLAERAGRSASARAGALTLLARVQAHAGDIEGGAARCDEALAMANADANTDFSATARSRCAKVYLAAGRPHDAIAQLRRALDTSERDLGATHPFIGETLGLLGGCLAQVGQIEEAYTSSMRGGAIQDAELPQASAQHIVSLTGRAGLAWSAGHHDQALAIARRSATLAHEHLEPSDPVSINAVCRAASLSANTQCSVTRPDADRCRAGLTAIAAGDPEILTAAQTAVLVGGGTEAVHAYRCLGDDAAVTELVAMLEPMLEADNLAFEYQGVLLALIAKTRLHNGDPAEAERFIRLAFKGDSSGAVQPVRKAQWHKLLAKALAAQGHTQDARIEAERVANLLADVPAGSFTHERAWAEAFLRDTK